MISRRSLLSRLVAGAVFSSVSDFAFAGRFPESAMVSPAKPIVLSRNENAYGPSQKVLAAMQEALSGSHRYPRAEYDSLRDKIAALHRAKPERIVLGCGSSELLCMAGAAVLGPGKKLVQASPTYPVLGDFARSTGA